jgi:hypothetical protein
MVTGERLEFICFGGFLQDHLRSLRPVPDDFLDVDRSRNEAEFDEPIGAGLPARDDLVRYWRPETANSRRRLLRRDAEIETRLRHLACHD